MDGWNKGGKERWVDGLRRERRKKEGVKGGRMDKKKEERMDGWMK